VFTYVYSRYALSLLLQILSNAVLDIKTRDVPTVSKNKLVAVTILQSFTFFFLPIFMWGGGGAPTVCFSPVFPWAKTGPDRVVWWMFSNHSENNFDKHLEDCLIHSTFRFLWMSLMIVAMWVKIPCSFVGGQVQ
jgi:hypothetical protein